jgi:Uma2 family endonuclease
MRFLLLTISRVSTEPFLRNTKPSSTSSSNFYGAGARCEPANFLVVPRPPEYHRDTMRIGLKQKLDYSDYAGIPPDGKRYEILDGELYVTPAPSPLHQRVSKRLQRQLEAYFEGRAQGEVFNAPIDVILTASDVVQPDLVVVTEARQISQRGIEGPPMLVVEVLSPSSRDQDRSTKARRYAQLGIRHYWVVDPDIPRLECYRAESGGYTLLVEGEGRASLSHPDFPDLTIQLQHLRG